MKYFVTIVQNDSTCACFAYDGRAAALGKFHTEMAYAMNAGITTLCNVMNSNGNVVASEKYTAPPAPAPEQDEGGDGE